MAAKLKILLIEPSPVISAGIKQLLGSSSEFEIVATLGDLTHCAERITVQQPDVVIVNPGVFDYSKRMSVRSAFSGFQEIVLVAMQYGVQPDEIFRQFDGVISVYDDQMHLMRKLREATGNRSHGSDVASGSELSDREKEILISVANGLTNKEIADKHNISVHTVISHRKNITRKTGIKSVSGLTIYAMLNNLISMSELE